MLEGYLHVSELENDYFVYEDAQSILKGRHTGMSYKAGDKITVMPKEVDLILLDSKWDLLLDASSDTSIKSKGKKSGKSKKENSFKRTAKSKEIKTGKKIRKTVKKSSSNKSSRKKR
jgi:ribonuclease R